VVGAPWKALKRFTSYTLPKPEKSVRTSSSVADRSTLAKNNCRVRGTGRSGGLRQRPGTLPGRKERCAGIASRAGVPLSSSGGAVRSASPTQLLNPRPATSPGAPPLTMRLSALDSSTAFFFFTCSSGSAHLTCMESCAREQATHEPWGTCSVFGQHRLIKTTYGGARSRSRAGTNVRVQTHLRLPCHCLNRLQRLVPRLHGDEATGLALAGLALAEQVDLLDHTKL